LKKFIPPLHDPLILGLTKALLPWALHNEGLKMDVSPECLKYIRTLPGSTVISLNHSDKADPVVAMALSKESGQDFNYLSARELFDENFGLRGWYMQRCGAYSVIRGQPEDVESREATINLIADGKHKLIMFPEGDVTGRHDKILPLKEDGIRNILEAQRRLLERGENRPVFLLPTASFYAVESPSSVLPEQQVKAELTKFINKLQSELKVDATDCGTFAEQLRQISKQTCLSIAAENGISLDEQLPPAVVLYSLRNALTVGAMHGSATETLDRLQQLLILASTLDSAPWTPEVSWRVVDRLQQLSFLQATKQSTRIVHVHSAEPINLQTYTGSQVSIVEDILRRSMSDALKLASAR
jgi:1-acyl-sn-glycerol-3-phosphate acyltransferase